MKFAAVIIAAGAILIAKMIYETKQKKERLRNQVEESFGKLPTQEYSEAKFRSIAYYYKKHMDERKDVDSITWNDVDMDDIYMLINNTYSSMGEEYLYAMLHKLEFNDEKLKQRDELAEYFAKNKEDRLALSYEFLRLGKMKENSLYEYVNLLDELKEESIAKHVLQALGLIVSPFVMLIHPATGLILSIGFLAYNIVTYYQTRANFEAYLSAVGYINRMVASVKRINALQIKAVQPIMETVTEDAKKFAEFRMGASIIGNGVGTSGNISDIILDYVRMMFHPDIIKFYQMLSTFKKNKDALNGMYENLGMIDSCISIASFRGFLPYYCKPCFSEEKTLELKAKELFHPMIDKPVTNSIDESRSVLITGSNASGKSTFLKTLAINAILSQTIGTSLCREYHANYFMVASSMALRDDILSQESYYIVEIKSLKRIFDRLDEKIPMLCFVDEVLRGTNTLERIAASSEILHHFGNENAMCFAATHDIELTQILDNVYSNYHFQEQIVDNNVIFDYKLYEGRAVSKNAIKLLGMIGYSREIIEKAESAANHFLDTGEWREI